MMNEVEALLTRLADLVADRVVGRVRPIISEEIRRDREAADGDRFLDHKALADLLGIRPDALRQRLRRGSKLAEIALYIDGRKVWRKSEVLSVLSRKDSPRLRVVGEP
jgi:hypothetical protein